MHPGGKKILRAAGKDGTEIFSKFSIIKFLGKFHEKMKIEETVVALLFEGYLKQ